MIGTSTNIRHTQRAHYPAISICRDHWKDIFFNTPNGREDVRDNLDLFKVSPRVSDVISSMYYFIRSNKSRYTVDVSGHVARIIHWQLIIATYFSGEEKIELVFSGVGNKYENRYDKKLSQNMLFGFMCICISLPYRTDIFSHNVLLPDKLNNDSFRVNLKEISNINTEYNA